MATTPQVVSNESIINTVMRRFGRRVYICSLHFMPFKERRDFKTRQVRKDDGSFQVVPWTDYTIEAVKTPEDHPRVCVVMDGLQRVFRGSEVMNGILMGRKYEDVPVSSEEIAVDLIKVATGAAASGPEDGTHPAVWISAVDEQLGDDFPKVETDVSGTTIYSKDWKLWGSKEFDKRFPKFAAECQAYAQRQFNYSKFLVSDGVNRWPNMQKRAGINEPYHHAAKWIGATKAQAPWIEEAAMTYGAMVDCPFCGQPTSGAHPVCSKCNRVINPELFDRLEEAMGMKPKQAPAV